MYLRLHVQYDTFKNSTYQSQKEDTLNIGHI